MMVWRMGIALALLLIGGGRFSTVQGSHASPSAVIFKAEPDTVVVQVLGTMSDSRFEPALVEIRPGDVIRFDVREGVHTVTAYHPDNRRDLGIPEGAESFDSGVLQAGQTWHLRLTVEGEYNYFCLPHERMGHVGQVRVGD